MQQIFNNKQPCWQTQSPDWHIKSLFYASTAILFCLFIWFLPYSHSWCEQIDGQFFLALNKTLAWSVYWQQICGWLNHPYETWLNLVLMLSINFLAIACLKKEERKQALIFTLYCWMFFQLGLFFSHAIFGKCLNIERASPSLVISPIIKLSALIKHPVKDFSLNSFPAGHTFVLIYWAGFTNKYASRKLMFLTYLIVILLIFPRLISGAHWLSDVIFTATISYAWLVLGIGTPLYHYIIENLACLRTRRTEK